MKTYSGYVGAALIILIVSVMANGNAYMFVTPTGSSDADGAVKAEADFTTGAGTITILLQNLQVNIKSVGEALSDLSFTLDGGQKSGTLSSSSGLHRTVNDDGTYTDGSTVATGWPLSTDGSGLLLDRLNAPGQKSNLIIGPPDGSNLYSAANGSIAGNGPHNPFLAYSASFTLSVTGVTADTIVTGAVFSFGTEGNECITGVPGNNVPEPFTLSFLAAGGLFLLRRKRTTFLG